MDWQGEARKAYFEKGKNMKEIAREIGRSRKCISQYLNSLPEAQMEKEKRKEINKRAREQRKSAKRFLKSKTGHIDFAILKQEHEVAVRILSREKYY